MSTTTTPTHATSIQAESSKILSQVAGYVGVRTVALGLRSGLLAAIAESADGVSARALAAQLDLDPFYVAVWARAAYAAEVLELATAAPTEGWDSRERRFIDLERSPLWLSEEKPIFGD